MLSVPRRKGQRWDLTWNKFRASWSECHIRSVWIVEPFIVHALRRGTNWTATRTEVRDFREELRCIGPPQSIEMREVLQPSYSDAAKCLPTEALGH
ncbi:hypothetical protein U1Q18_051032 [Sarracenia purpurea var. burkii]